MNGKMEAKRMRHGFTLMELLVVCVIIVILVGGVIALYGAMFSKDRVKTASNTLQVALLDGRQNAATQRISYFIRLSNANMATDPSGMVYIYMDKDYNKQLSTATDTLTSDPQKMPKGVIFWAPYYPDYIMVEPNGAMVFSATSGGTDVGFPGGQTFAGGPTGYSTTAYENNFANSNPNIMGDIVMSLMDLQYKVCLDVDPVSGKIRKSNNLFK